MDYRELLKKYIWHVVECEGTNFIGETWEKPESMSHDEYAELQKIDKEIYG